MGSVATLLLWGHLYSLFNLRWLFAAGYLLFAIGSVLCGAPKNMNTEIAGRVIAGMGGASVYLGALNVSRTLSINRRPLLTCSSMLPPSLEWLRDPCMKPALAFSGV